MCIQVMQCTAHGWPCSALLSVKQPVFETVSACRETAECNHPTLSESQLMSAGECKPALSMD